MPALESNRHSLLETDISAEAIRFASWYQDIWRSHNRMPQRDEVDPIGIPDLLNSIWIYEKQDDGEFLCRFAGEAIDRRWRKGSIQFQKLSVILPADRLTVVTRRIDICMTRGSIAHGWSLDPDPASRRRVERCFAPFARDDGTPMGIIGIALYGNAVTVTDRFEPPKLAVRFGLYDPVTFEKSGDAP